MCWLSTYSPSSSYSSSSIPPIIPPHHPPSSSSSKCPPPFFSLFSRFWSSSWSSLPLELSLSFSPLSPSDLSPFHLQTGHFRSEHEPLEDIHREPSLRKSSSASTRPVLAFSTVVVHRWRRLRITAPTLPVHVLRGLFVKAELKSLSWEACESGPTTSRHGRNWMSH